ncbi:hypothetical protein LRR81_08200 [Metabacillus sp. GX 13764]|uniref:hypothetical protein n=1 Tax=Metabacillus kandeliae TaxID=2900151 RepID=UPI001E4C7F74|nr:hypothetical protein [Metabacillus kandeliae]MCD7034213.1 hypothetical protein [Metabacillus kandeliae]
MNPQPKVKYPKAFQSLSITIPALILLLHAILQAVYPAISPLWALPALLLAASALFVFFSIDRKLKMFGYVSFMLSFLTAAMIFH